MYQSLFRLNTYKVVHSNCLMNVLIGINDTFHSFCRKPRSSLPLHIKTELFCSSIPPQSEDDLVSEAVSILKHHRSKTRWSRLRSLLTASKHQNLSPSQFSEIGLQIRNNGHLVQKFFNFTVNHSLCAHSLLSYSTVIHLLCRARLKYQALTLIKSAMVVFSAAHQHNDGGSTLAILESLIKTYRVCDSAPFVFDLLVKACVESKKIDLAIDVYERLKFKNVFLRTDTCNALIELVSKSQGGFAGYDLYMRMFNPGVESMDKNVRGKTAILPSSNTINVVMMGFYREGLVDKVEEMWEEMEKVGCAPNLYSYNVLMAAYCDNGRMEKSMRIFEEIECKGFKPDAITYNTIIGGYCGVGEVEKAEEIFREMVTKGVECTCITYEHLINGYCDISDIDSATLLYKDMCRKSFSPGGSTINVIIRVFCEKVGASAALEFWRMAEKKHEVFLLEGNYVGLVTGLCQEGKMEEALNLQVEMVSKGFDPSSELYDAFVDGYVKLGNYIMASKLRKEMFSNKMSKQT